MITPEKMKELEKNSSIEPSVLMERAAAGVVEEIREKCKDKRVLILCYHGNNGGDGLAVGRMLSEIAEVDVLFVGDEEKFSPAAKAQFEQVHDDPAIQFVTLETAEIDEYEVFVDALLGIGFSGTPKKEVGPAIDLINKAQGFVVAVDIPTGFDAYLGKPSEKMVEADLIVTFHDAKPGLELFSGKVTVVDIGLSG